MLPQQAARCRHLRAQLLQPRLAASLAPPLLLRASGAGGHTRELRFQQILLLRQAAAPVQLRQQQPGAR